MQGQALKEKGAGGKNYIAMRKVIGIGEAILDIIFRDGQPTAAVPGGSVLNALVSLSRAGVPVQFISETGDDRVGRIILRFLEENGIPTDTVSVFPDGQSPVSLAFLDEHREAEYLFYKNYPRQRLDVDFPRINEDDIVLLGSYYALNPALHDKVLQLLDLARERRAMVYYDPNFRAAHQPEAMKLAPAIIENLEHANVVRGSKDDFFYMYGLTDVDKIYRDKVKFYCPNFLCTAGRGQVALRTASLNKEYAVQPVEAASTIGAGDNFNAGILYGLLKYDVRYDALNNLGEAMWDKIVSLGMEFSAEVCKGLDNSVSPEFAGKYRL